MLVMGRGSGGCPGGSQALSSATFDLTRRQSSTRTSVRSERQPPLQPTTSEPSAGRYFMPLAHRRTSR